MALPTYLLLNNAAKCIESMTTSFKIGISEAEAADLVPICVGHTPDQAPPDHIVLLERTPGGLLSGLPAAVDLMIQVIARGITHFTARDFIWEVYKSIHEKCCHDLEYPDLESAGAKEAFVTIDATGSPAWIGIDEKGRHQFSCNFQFSYRSPSGGGWL